jgi:hypothetical protein
MPDPGFPFMAHLQLDFNNRLLSLLPSDPIRPTAIESLWLTTEGKVRCSIVFR